MYVCMFVCLVHATPVHSICGDSPFRLYSSTGSKSLLNASLCVFGIIVVNDLFLECTNELY